MQEFLSLLKDGILLDIKLTESFQKILETLISLNVLEIRKNRYFLQKRFCIGRVELTRSGDGFITPLPRGKEQDWRVKKGLLKGAQKGDIVLAKMLNKKQDGRIFSIVVCTLESKEKSVLCYLEKYKLDCIAISIPNEITYKIKATQRSLKTLPQNTILRLNPKNGEILEILGSLDDPQIDEILSLGLFSKQESFSMQAELEASSFKEVRLRDFKERINYSHLPFCAIDPASAKDHDDAVYFSAKDSTLYVAIADVSYYVKCDSALDLDAKKRGFSIYFPHKAIPMLPRILSENLCSLQENKLRLAMVWKLRLHKRTKAVLQSELCEGIVKVKQKLSYDEVDNLLENGDSKIIKNPIKSMLLELNCVTQTLRKKRLKSGFDFLSEENKIELDKNFMLKNMQEEKQSTSHQLIEECMLLANIQSAKMQNENIKNSLNLGIYRVHKKPKYSDIVDLFNELTLLKLWDGAIPSETRFHEAILKVQKEAKKRKLESYIDKLIIKSMQQANYASINIGHFGLGFYEYSHFTSPIRRYSDLVLHRILKNKICLKQDSNLKESLPQICEDLSQKEREVSKIEMDFKDRKFARFLQNKIGQSFIGTIIDDKNPQLVSIKENPLSGARVVILKGSGIKYQKVRVQIIDVNIATAKVYGRILECFNEDFGIKCEEISNYLLKKQKQKAKALKDNAKMESKRFRKNIKKAKSFIPRHKRKKG
ncbi:MAG: ribonuclease R [Helicobacteraceae bacterium]|nr:ribonuclease R [Helicobacteraceae bacterium]